MAVNIGDLAPSFSLPDQNGNTFNLNDYLGKENIILYFYPKDETPGCITEACSFRDNIIDLEGFGCIVVGISKDSVKSHAKFAAHYHLPFTLLSDSKNEIRRMYGVESSILGLLPGRKTFMINKRRMITHIFDYQFKARKHVIEALKALADE